MSSDVDVQLLGRLVVRAGDSVVQFEGAKQRALFIVLALHVPDPVSVDELVDALWPEQPPGDGLKPLQQQVYRLRRSLGSVLPLRHGAAGCALDIDADALDVRRFERLLQRARQALAGGVILEAPGANKIQVIKVVRELVPGLGLKEAKDLVESTPTRLYDGKVNKETAEKAKARLEAEGATVTLK